MTCSSKFDSIEIEPGSVGGALDRSTIVFFGIGAAVEFSF
jgi:hypothetical protein